MKHLTLAQHAFRQHSSDKIYVANQKAREAIMQFGEDNVINSTLGECLDDNGHLMIIPTIIEMLRNMPVEEMCSYAPIAGLKEFNKAVQISLFGKENNKFFVESVVTPGGTGALRHAIWNFLEDGDAAITTNWYWTPYKGICEEHNRRLETFEMFDNQGRFNLNALDKKLEKIINIQNYILIILNTPSHNPTGYSMSKDEMDGVVAIIKKYAKNENKKITLCLDVTYIDYDGGFEKSREIFDCIQDMPENTMVTVVYSMSKSFTMSGMRCGALLCLGETKEAAQEFKQAMQFSSRAVWSNVNRMAQRVLVDISLNSEIKAKIDNERKVFRDIIASRGHLFVEKSKKALLSCCPYKDGFFITIPCRNPDLIAQKLSEKQVYVVPLGEGIRFSPCAVKTEKCAKAPMIIKEVMNLWD